MGAQELDMTEVAKPPPPPRYLLGFPGDSVIKNACQCRRCGSIPESGRSPEEGNGNPLQYSCLGYPVDKGACQATIHGIAKELDMT